MRKRQLIVGIALIAILIGIAVAAGLTRQSYNERKSVKWWFKQFDDFPARGGGAFSMGLGSRGRTLIDARGREIEDQPMAALRALGQESVPYLIRVLRQRETFFTQAYGRCWKTLPNPLRRITPPPVDIYRLHWNAAVALAGLGTNAQPAIPALLDVWDSTGRMNIEFPLVCVLRNCGVSGDQLYSFIDPLLPRKKYFQILQIVETMRLSSPGISKAMVLMLQQPQADVRRRAAACIANSKPSPDITLDALTKALSDRESEVRYAAVSAIEKLGTNAMPARAELEKATGDGNTMVQTVARRVLEQLR